MGSRSVRPPTDQCKFQQGCVKRNLVEFVHDKFVRVCVIDGGEGAGLVGLKAVHVPLTRIQKVCHL